MSISPKEKEIKDIKISTVRKTGYIIKKSLSFFWTNPLKYSFYIVALIGVIGNVVGRILPIPFYVLLSILGFVEIYKELYIFIYPEIKILSDNNKK